MNAYETYLQYTALRLHFTSKYDYFKYKGAVKRTVSNFETINPNERRLFENIAALKEPKTYLVGNFIFGESNYIRDFNNDNYLKYRKFLTNGDYYLKEDLGKMKKPLKDNFQLEDENDIPYISQLLMSDDITLYTGGVFNALIDWTSKVKNPLIKDQTGYINKTYKFFRIDLNKSKKIILESS